VLSFSKSFLMHGPNFFCFLHTHQCVESFFLLRDGQHYLENHLLLMMVTLMIGFHALLCFKDRVCSSTCQLQVLYFNAFGKVFILL